jgi:hypothetical protein
MNEIDRVVFLLSPKAVSMLQQGRMDLDSQLSTLIVLIDGVTPVAQFKPFLKGLDPIEPKFMALEALGYIIRAGNVSSEAVKGFQEAVDAGGPISGWHSIDAQSPDSGFVALDPIITR